MLNFVLIGKCFVEFPWNKLLCMEGLSGTNMGCDQINEILKRTWEACLKPQEDYISGTSIIYLVHKMGYDYGG